MSGPLLPDVFGERIDLGDEGHADVLLPEDGGEPSPDGINLESEDTE